MGKTHLSGPAYGGLTAFTVVLGDCAASATTTGYLYIPDGYIFHLDKVALTFISETDIEAGTINIGPSSDTDGWVDNTNPATTTTGQELTINGTADTYITGADYVSCALTFGTGDLATDVVIVLFGYLEEEDPTGV